MQGISFGVVKRQPHCSPETWLVEPFDEDLDLWTLGTRYGFVWVIMSGDPEATRCRSLPRAEGIEEINEQLDVEPSHVVLAGSLAGETIDLELIHAMVNFGRSEPIQLGTVNELIRRACDRLRDLQHYDGKSRIDQLDRDVEDGGVTVEGLWSVLGIRTKP